MLTDGSYERVKRSGPRVRAQETLYHESVEAARAGARVVPRLRPLMSLEEEGQEA
jgi:hypothetical protein